MLEKSVWDVRIKLNEDGSIYAVEIAEIIDVESEEWKFAIFMQEQAENYMKTWEPLGGMG
jgi:hypothetical protein